MTVDEKTKLLINYFDLFIKKTELPVIIQWAVYKENWLAINQMTELIKKTQLRRSIFQKLLKMLASFPNKTKPISIDLASLAWKFLHRWDTELAK